MSGLLCICIPRYHPVTKQTMASPDFTVLHRLIWFDDHEGLNAYLEDLEGNEGAEKDDSSVNELEESNSDVLKPCKIIDTKFRGLAPIHLAIQLGYKECVEVLLKHGADMLSATELGFLPLQEATSIGDRDMMREILVKRHDQMRKYVYKRQPHLYKVVKEEIDNFYLEMNWDFKSWGKLI